MKSSNKECFKKGIIDGIPIALGYLAVSFSLGIKARQAGISVLYATIMSFTNVTSAGEFGAIAIIKEGGGMIAMALSQLVINLRYMLMSCSLSQKIDNKKPFAHRFGVAFGVTDEIFGISIAAEDKLNPFYSYGAMAVAVPGWTLGTALGVIFGDILPPVLVSSLGVALFGMFIAIIIPPAKLNKHVRAAVIIAMLSSFAWRYVPYIKKMANGTKIIILTVVISVIFAILCPVEDEDHSKKEGSADGL